MSSVIARGCRSVRTWAVFTVVIASIALAQDAPQDKGSDAREKVRQVYKSDYAKLDTPVSKDKLARKLIGVANRFQKDPVKRDALLDEAVDLATSAGAIVVVMTVADARHPAGSPEIYAYKQEIFKKLGDAELDNKQRLVLADRISYTISQAVHDAQFSAAQQLAQLAFDLCGKLPGAVRDARKQSLQADLRQIEGLVELSEQVAEARETLKSKPEDAAANQLVGCYLSFVLGDWTTGKSNLQRGGGELARLANLDANPPKDGKTLMKLGDDWYALAAESEAVYRIGLFERAADCYRQSQQLVFGADRERVTKQLAAIGRESPGVLGNLAAPDMAGAPTVASLNPAPGADPAEEAAEEKSASKPVAGGKKVAEAKPKAPKKEKLPQFAVVAARYGTDNFSVDLTKRLQDASKDGFLLVVVQNNLSDDKSLGDLYLRLRLGDELLDQKIGYSKIVFLDSRKPPKIESKELVILDAIFGAGIRGEPSMVDVKEHLITAMSQNLPNTPVRLLMRGIPDPVFGVSKLIVIRYAINGKVFVKTFEENQPIRLTEM